MTQPTSTAGNICFGMFEFDFRSAELLKQGQRIRLQGQPAQILTALLERPGEVVTREELRTRLWPGNTFVDFEHSLNSAVRRLRRALNDSSERPRYVDTITRRGYRFIARVEKAAHPGPGSTPVHHTVHSLAVLPFENASTDPEAEYLSDGLTESIISSLSQLPQMRVMARSAVFRYKSHEADPRTVGRKLNVQTVLVGRVLQRGDAVVIGTELVEVRNGWQLWGEQYNRSLSDVSSIQDEISRKISEKLHLRLTGERVDHVGKHHSRQPEAYQDYLKGRYYWNKVTDEGLRKGIEYFERAIAKDPNFALAYVGLADSYVLVAFSGLAPPLEVLPKAKEAALKALGIDNGLAEAHASLAGIHKMYDWDWPAAEIEYKRALELNPNYETAHRMYAAYLSALGRSEEAMREIERARELDPLSLVINMEVAWDSYMGRQYGRAVEEALRTLDIEAGFAAAYLVLGLACEQTARYDDAIAAFEKALGGSLRNPAVLSGLAHTLARTGRTPEAMGILKELEELSERSYVPAYWLAVIWAGVGEKAEALNCLERACEQLDVWLVWLKQDPRLDLLRSEPRFEALLRRVGLVT